MDCSTLNPYSLLEMGVFLGGGPRASQERRLSSTPEVEDSWSCKKRKIRSEMGKLKFSV